MIGGQKRWLSVCLLVMLLCLCGCDLELASPETLITPPKSNQEKLQQKQLVTSFLSREEHLIMPAALSMANAYQYLDLDQDGQEEIVAFYANKESNFMLGFLILDQEEKTWYLKHKAVVYGTDVNYFLVQDLDDDGMTEILLGVNTGYGAQKELYVYQMGERELIDTTYGDPVTYDQITLAHTNDDRYVLVTARMDTSVLEGNSNVVVYDYRDGILESIYDETFTGYCSDMRFDQIGAGVKGVYLAMRHNHFTNILLLKETAGEFAVVMEHPLQDDYEGVERKQIFRDENNDGILEILSLWSPEVNNSDKTYQDYIQVWLQWDGKDGLTAVDALLEDSNAGYRFSVPLEWLDSLYYDFRSQDTIVWVDFYTQDEDMDFKTVFSIAAIDRLVWENMENTDGMLVLGNHPMKNKIYVAEIHKKDFNGFPVDASRLIACLQIEGGERK